jgi:hypothetical protein
LEEQQSEWMKLAWSQQSRRQELCRNVVLLMENKLNPYTQIEEELSRANSTSSDYRLISPDPNRHQ